MGSGTELWGFVFWPGREAVAHSCKRTQATAQGANSTVMIDVPIPLPPSFGGRAATRWGDWRKAARGPARGSRGPSWG